MIKNYFTPTAMTWKMFKGHAGKWCKNWVDYSVSKKKLIYIEDITRILNGYYIN